MNLLARYFAICILLLTVGCNNLSPRDNFSPELQQKMENLKTQQATMESIQNGLKVEIARLQNSLELSNSNNNQIQQGWLNFQSDGILVAGFAIVTIGMLLYYMLKSQQYKKSTEILGEQINLFGDENLKERIVAAAWNTRVEKTICKLVG